MRSIEAARAHRIAEAARAAARDESRWARSKPWVDWMAVKLLIGRGATQIEVKKRLDVSRHSVCDRVQVEDWVKIEDEGVLEALSRDVAAAGLARAAEIGRKAEGNYLNYLARSAEWRPLARVKYYQRHCAVAPAELPEVRAKDDPENAEFDFRGQAREVLPKVRVEAAGLGDVARVALIDRWMGELASGASASEAHAERALGNWRVFARAEQVAPEGDWRTWLLMGGRGSGKTRAGAEWVREMVASGRARRIALVGPTLHDVREVMIEGPSGLLAVSGEDERPSYSVARRRVTWKNGAVGYVFSAEDPESLRGPQFDAAWCDEIGAWARDEKTWDMLGFGLRLGGRPRAVATTTPRPRTLVRRLVRLAEEGVGGRGRGGVVMSRSATRDNAANLSPGFVEEMEVAYSHAGRLGLQELEGQLVDDAPGALWTRAMIEEARVRLDEIGAMDRVVVAVDPPAGVGRDACGIVVAGKKAKSVYVLADGSVRGLRPGEWAGRVVALARMWSAGTIVAEANQGGEMVREVLNAAGASQEARVRLTHARGSKYDRALPLSQAYEEGKVRHAGMFRELEDEMCAFGAEMEAGASPDRVDALVWAVKELTETKPRPGIF
jgi:phage terminase large subunit-like protein